MSSTVINNEMHLIKKSKYGEEWNIYCIN